MNGFQPEVRVVDIAPALRLRSTLRLCRVAPWLLFFLAVAYGAALPIAILAFAAVVLGLVSLSRRRVHRVLLVIELTAGAILSCVVVWSGVAELIAQNIDVASGVLLATAVMASVWLIHRVRSFMYPATLDPLEFERVSELLHDDIERRPAPRTAAGTGRVAVEMLSLFMIGLFVGPLRTAYFICLITLASAYWAVRSVWPALRSLHQTGSFPLFAMSLAPRSRRASGSYVWYLVRRGGNRPEAFRYLSASGLCLVGFFSIGQVAEYIPIVPTPLVGPLLLVLAYVMYRSALHAFASGLSEREAHRVVESSDFSLYLRSFADDPVELDFAARGWRRLLLLLVFGRMSEAGVFRAIRVEEFLARAIWPRRPLLAVASSGNTNPVGALQLKFTEDGWRDGVMRMARRATSILLVAGDSPGLRWELSQLREDSAIQTKVLLLFPPVREDYLEPRWSACVPAALRVPSDVVRRAVAVKLESDGGGTIVTADWPTPAAYRMALRLGETLVAEPPSA